jgi:hypothetical protein
VNLAGCAELVAAFMWPFIHGTFNFFDNVLSVIGILGAKAYQARVTPHTFLRY